MDCDPRDDYDSRGDERLGPNRQRRGGSGDDPDRDDWGQREIASRDRKDDASDLARGPADSRQSNGGKQGHDPRDDARWPDRERDHAPRDVFTRHLDLPRGREREIVHDRFVRTPCVARSRERWRPSARFEWSPVVISEIATIGRLIPDRPTFGACVSKVSSRRSACLAHAITRWP
jgi:hypothetical protein